MSLREKMVKVKKKRKKNNKKRWLKITTTMKTSRKLAIIIMISRVRQAMRH
jgi:hypothetical protein